MQYDFDMRTEETSVEHVLRRVQRRLRRRQEESLDFEDLGSPEFHDEMATPFENLRFDPDLYFQLDYAAQIYDPRTVPGNTRLYRLKSLIMRTMRVYSTRQVEFNATVMRLLNRFFDIFNDLVGLFAYFRRAEVNMIRRMEHTEKVVGNVLKRLDIQQRRIERVEEYEQDLNLLRRRLEHVEAYDRDLYLLRQRTERIEGWEPLLTDHRSRIEKLEGWETKFNMQRKRLEGVEAVGRKLSRRITPLEDLHKRLELALSENTVLRRRLDQIISRMGNAGVSARSGVTEAASDMGGVPSLDRKRLLLLNDHLYFPYLNEDRGIEEVIRERIGVYVPFFAKQRISSKIKNPYIIDIGCGRGEFLDLCAEEGLPAKGLDINEDMFKHCKDKGHDVELGEANAFLESLGDNSLRGIISCQVIEHMAPYDLLAFLRLCSTKLARGGRLVLETPNPTTFFALSMFYRDFTHEQPIHPHTLVFLLKELGFKKVRIEEIHPAPEGLKVTASRSHEMTENMEKLNEMIYGHLDYTAFAIK